MKREQYKYLLMICGNHVDIHWKIWYIFYGRLPLTIMIELFTSCVDLSRKFQDLDIRRKSYFWEKNRYATHERKRRSLDSYMSVMQLGKAQSLKLRTHSSQCTSLRPWRLTDTLRQPGKSKFWVERSLLSFFSSFFRKIFWTRKRFESGIV